MRVFRNEDGSCYHLRVREGQVSPNILAVGSPERVERVAEFLDDPRCVAENRGHLCVNGRFEGMPVSVLNTGMGTASASIILQEAIASLDGSEPHVTLIRLGTAGSLQPRVKVGHLVISTGTVRDDGTADKIVGKEYPSIADYHAFFPLIVTARARGLREREDFWVGVTHCKDELYFVENPKDSPVHQARRELMEGYRSMGVLATEMEFSIFTILSDYFNQAYAGQGVAREIATACLLLVVSPYDEGMQDVSFAQPSQDLLIETGLRALLQRRRQSPEAVPFSVVAMDGR